MKLFCLSAILACLAASSAAADVLIDQEYVAPPTGYLLDYSGDYMAQTFTARNTGQITSIALQLSLTDDRQVVTGVTDNLHFMLTRTNSVGEPVPADVLATHEIMPFELTLDYAGLPMYEFDLTSQNVQVQSGDVLALVLTTQHGYRSNPGSRHYMWNFSLWFDKIAGGKFSAYSPDTHGPRWFSGWYIKDPTLTGDAGYRITIDAVPEPSATLLSALAIAAVVVSPHRAPNRKVRHRRERIEPRSGVSQ